MSEVVAPRACPRSTPILVSQPAPAQTAFVPVGSMPFGLALTTVGASGFASLSGSPNQLAVLSTRTFAPTVVRKVPLPVAGASGLTLTSSGRYLLVASGSGLTIVDVARAERGPAGAVVRSLSSPAGDGAIQVVTSPGDRFAFVSLEHAGKIAVFNLRAAIAGAGSGYVGAIPLGISPIGMAVSPDGRWVYANSEAGRGLPYGTLSVIDLRRAETEPTRSVLASAPAGCAPLRIAVSADGETIWVTARSSDAVIAFSASKLRSDPGQAALSSVNVGPAPVGLVLLDRGRRLLVAVSNQFGKPPVGTLALLDTAAALRSQGAGLLGLIPAGRFPRELAVEPDGRTVLVTNFDSAQLEAVAVQGLP